MGVRVLFLVLALVLAAPSARASDPSTAAGILDFADQLSDTGETYRAVTEYLRALHHFGGEPGVKKRATLGLADAYARAGRFSDAADRLFELDPADLTPDLKLARGDALMRAGRDREAVAALLAPGADPASSRLGTLAWLKAGGGDNPPPGTDAKLIAAYDAINFKSPATAGLLSALLPGAGHFYVDRPHDAAMAFILNGAFIYGTVESARRKEWGLAGILGAAEALWYSGTIIGSVNGAVKWNERARGEFFRSGREGMTLRWSAAALGDGGLMSVSLSW